MREDLKLMRGDDYAEWCLLKRRLDYLELKADYFTYGFNPKMFDEAYSDVKSLRFVRVDGTPEKKGE